MKNWLTIGAFSKLIGVSPKALRLYEKMGLIKSHTRGENGYRYYDRDQVEISRRLKEFKNLGFTLSEIKGLLHADAELDSEKILSAMKERLSLVENQVEQLNEQRDQLENILASLKRKSEPLKAQQRRAIMSFYGQVSIIVTGNEGLEKTAHFIQSHFHSANQEIPILQWRNGLALPQQKPYILTVKESDLVSEEISKIHPDIVVIKSLGTHSSLTEENYLKLYTQVGPHVNTIINADDRASVELAGNSLVKKGRIFYFSKNRGLQKQIKKIGGIVSDGEEVEIYGFNLKPEIIQLKLEKIMPFEDEIALLSSYGAVMTVGMEKSHLRIS